MEFIAMLRSLQNELHHFLEPRVHHLHRRNVETRLDRTGRTRRARNCRRSHPADLAFFPRLATRSAPTPNRNAAYPARTASSPTIKPRSRAHQLAIAHERLRKPEKPTHAVEQKRPQPFLPSIPRGNPTISEYGSCFFPAASRNRSTTR